MAIKILSAALIGAEAEIIEIEATAGGGDFGQITIVGLPDTSVSEAKERVRSALMHGGMEFPKRKITVNLAPADLKKIGPIYDLPIALSILSLKYNFNFDFSTCLIAGELSLTGEIRKIKGIIPIAIKAKEIGLKYLFVPSGNTPEVDLIKGVTIFALENLKQTIEHLQGKKLITPFKHQKIPASLPCYTDFSDIKGQSEAKRALEIAIAGGHNILISGPPGSGKTMLAKAAVGIMPDLTDKEKLEITKIYSIADNAISLSGNMAYPHISRPFRSPHHSASAAALIGGGFKFRPGEISLAHLGILFLDEFPEFSRHTIESLRQPLEEGCITISRAAGNYILPARFIMIATMNPCPCGFKGVQNKDCACSEEKIKNYHRKISGPILDRIDLRINVANLKIEELEITSPQEPSCDIKMRIIKARRIQAERLSHFFPPLNSLIASEKIKQLIKINQPGLNLLARAAKNLGLSNRSYFKILKIARTIADLDNSLFVAEKHIAEALQYRSSWD